MNYYLSFSSKPIPESGQKSMIDGVIEGSEDHIAGQCFALMERIAPDTPKKYLPAFANARFKDGHKIGANWQSCNILHIDIDGGLPANAEELLLKSPYRCFFYQTPSSCPENLKYRVYVFLDRELCDSVEYVANYDHNCQLFLDSCGLFTQADRQTKDAARFMYISARPSTFRYVLDRPPMPFSTTPQATVVGPDGVRRRAGYKSSTVQQFNASHLLPLMRARFIDMLGNYRWVEGEKHLRVLMLASRASGYSIPHQDAEGLILRSLPGTVRSVSAAQETIAYGYARPRFPDLHEMQWLHKRFLRLKWAQIRAVQAAYSS